ncbi:hypothetical protein PPERSA_02281 [Pseudocohnilembus persalinus]|uniref:Uncharacterized protein n=1 Tax=Pseudocohnilembus persalinus TaxID=266149 RepID=A0A0V0QKR8_PSEPJ|nr:hypothetical protein PPERSA_02281 [Pseudocohnilembus persalinus]|eukprot:KRX02791.1 hypothetical protein PPERSA_02281 [Pseudocohnilembus persalinus]
MNTQKLHRIKNHLEKKRNIYNQAMHKNRSNLKFQILKKIKDQNDKDAKSHESQKLNDTQENIQPQNQKKSQNTIGIVDEDDEIYGKNSQNTSLDKSSNDMDTYSISSSENSSELEGQQTYGNNLINLSKNN